MRIIKVYKDWTSPGALIGHILSGEELAVVHYGEGIKKHSQVIYDALKEAKKMIWAGLISRVNNLLWMGAILAGVTWPLVKLSEDIGRFFMLLFGAAFMVALVRLLGTYIARYKVGRFDIDNLEHVIGPVLAPPPTAHRETKINAPSLRRSMMFLVVMIFMNCLVLASPAYPARIEGRYIEQNIMVAPWAVWESTVKIQQGSMIAIVTAPETDQIWVARANYVVRQSSPDIPSDWLEWTERRFSYLVNQLTQSLFQSIPPDMTVDEAIGWITNIWVSDFDGDIPLDILRDAIIINFQERYEGSVELLSLEINIEHLSLSDYRKEMK